MAVKNILDYSMLSDDFKDETEDLNEKLLQLLSAQKISSPNEAKKSNGVTPYRTARNDNISSPMVNIKESGSPHLGLYKYDHYFSHHESPVKMPSVSSYLPPIGVFWDIENCQVPKGRSAIAVTQVIRDKFFGSYREAEFIVVCDVQKENTQVMQELNDAQVNLIHVAATCKNAADEKLKQSIRRFADIHGSPAAIILISGDINFAADLSDLRHRKKIHVILLHRKKTSNALILCANEHYDFMELMEALPSRTPVKVTEPYDLLVSNLPEDKDVFVIKRRLKQLSENCGGRVMDIQSNTAIIRFTSESSADRAQKRMDGEFVYGAKISVKFQKDKEKFSNKDQGGVAKRNRAVSESEIATNSSRQMYSANSSVAGARTLHAPHYQSVSPVVGAYSAWAGVRCASVGAPPGLFQPPPIFVGRPYLNNSDIPFNRAYNELARIQPPAVWHSQQCGHMWEEQFKVEKAKSLGRRIHVPQVRDNNATNGSRSRTPEDLRRARNPHNSFSRPPEWNMLRQPCNTLAVPANFNGNGNSQANPFKRRSPSPMYGIQGRDPNLWNGQVKQKRKENQHSTSLRNIRTPSPYEPVSLQPGNQQNNNSFYHPSDTESDEIEKFFSPIGRSGSDPSNGSFTPIELQITNLDQNIDPKEMKRILSSAFMEHVAVLHVSVFVQSDGNFAASVKVPSLSDAQYAISQLHRQKIGYKRILISYAHSGGPNPQLVRAQIVMLLQDVPGHKLPLFKFREMYESRFMISISVSELYKMKDVCIIREDPGGRMVLLNPDHRNTPSPCFSQSTQEGHVDLPYCTKHTPKPWSDKGWAEQEMASLPDVKISLKILAPRIHQLLTSHNGSLPLPSLPYCYDAEFNEPLQVFENGVPLEHLVSCLSSVELKQGLGSVKYITWAGNKSPDDSYEDNKCVSPPLANQLALFSRELVDLLKTAPHCQLPFNRFIPAYHHHFGRQCRVADYGFTKLIDLLEALTHTVQVMGEGNKRVVTLSHRAQIRRFTSDLLRVLKSKASKQVALSEFPSVYARVIAKPWDIVDYGVCEIEDILSEVSENTVVVTNIGDNDKMIAIPKREQTLEEIERTKQFAVEVVELLQHAPQCRMLFNRFVPSYHHHFGHQCRVSDYGFTKLIELFEAIPDVVKIEDASGGERLICLTEKEGLRILGEQVSKLISRTRGGLTVSSIPQTFLRQFGYALRPELFGCNSVLQLMQKLEDSVRVIDLATGPIIVAIDKFRLQQLALQCRRVLMDQPNNKTTVEEFQKLYAQYYFKPCNIDELKKDLPHVLRFTTTNNEWFVELTALQCFACNLYRVMMSYGGTLNLAQFETAYLEVVGSCCKPAQYGFQTVLALLQALPCTVLIKVGRKKKVICLNKKLATVGIALPSTYTSASSQQDTDSSNESFESSSSSRANLSNPCTSTNGACCWQRGAQDNNFWSKESDHWKALTSAEGKSQRWPQLESGGDIILKSLIRTPTMHNFPPPPPKPDSPPDERANEDRHWTCSLWATPANFTYTEDEHPTNVEVPPLTLPTWNQIASADPASNLLSPTKNLLPAAANPLNPRTSPYFSSKVIAPHPSELPLPSMSLTPKKLNMPKSSKSETNDRNHDEDEGNNDGKSANQENKMAETEEVDDTASKPFFTAKTRLAAQFNEPIES